MALSHSGAEEREGEMRIERESFSQRDGGHAGEDSETQNKNVRDKSRKAGEGFLTITSEGSIVLK